MKQEKYKLEDLKIGNHVMFKRNSINNFDMAWTVTGFLNNMIEVTIDEMGYKDRIHISVDDIYSLQNVNDQRFNS